MQRRKKRTVTFVGIFEEMFLNDWRLVSGKIGVCDPSFQNQSGQEQFRFWDNELKYFV